MSGDLTSLVILSVACVGLAGILGAVGLRLVRGRSVALSLLIASLTPVLGVALALLASVHAMSCPGTTLGRL